jgi:hypothetical protein
MKSTTLTAGLAGVLIGGAFAEVVGDFLLLFTGGLAAGGFAGAVVGLIRDWRGRRRAGANTTYLYPPGEERTSAEMMGFYGSVAGGALGLVAAILDALIG